MQQDGYSAEHAEVLNVLLVDYKTLNGQRDIQTEHSHFLLVTKIKYDSTEDIRH